MSDALRDVIQGCVLISRGPLPHLRARQTATLAALEKKTFDLTAMALRMTRPYVIGAPIDELAGGVFGSTSELNERNPA